MYEIWLMLNIVWEMALGVWPWLLGLAALWLLLLARARGRGRAAWRAALPGAIGVGAVLALVIFFVVPGWIGSSLTELKYWVDWANLLGIAAAWGALGLIFAWPLLAGMRPRRRF